MKYASDQSFSDPSDLLEYLLFDKSFKTLNIYEANHIGTGGMIFRGQTDASWDLNSSAFRPGSLDRFTPQPPPGEISINGLKFHLGFQLLAEARAVHLFLENADALGIPTPIDYTTTKHGLDLILVALNNKEDFDYNTPYPPESFQRATALAQHHGVPTRFLDWSESPLVACFFAATGASDSVDKNQEIAIFYTNCSSLRKKDSPVGLVQAPRYENSHLLQQKGIFTSIINANVFFLKNGRWPSIEDFSSKLQIHRIRLPATQADNLLRLLFDLKITQLSLMPTLDNAAKAFLYTQKLFDKTT